MNWEHCLPSLITHYSTLAFSGCPFCSLWFQMLALVISLINTILLELHMPFELASTLVGILPGTKKIIRSLVTLDLHDCLKISCQRLAFSSRHRCCNYHIRDPFAF